jgi:hypothetical protein
VLYASIQIPPHGGPPNTGLLGLYRTDNAWDATPTWIQVPTGATGAGYCGPQKCGYSHTISVNPSDANMVFAGGDPLWRCSNCGLSPDWTNISINQGVHPDFHALSWAGGRLIAGNDGGVASTTSLGASWTFHSQGLPTLMFFSGALHPTNPNIILAGLRDFPLTIRRTNTNAWTVLPNLSGREWGEAEVAMSSTHPDTDWMAAWLWGTINRTTNGGVSGVGADGGLDKGGAAFVAPVRMCPANDDVFLTGTNRMWRTNAFFTAPTVQWTINGPLTFWPIESIAFFPGDTSCNTYAFGDKFGRIQLTTNGGATWAYIDPGYMVPFRSANGLAFDPTNGNVLYAALSSFDDATPGKPGHVFKTTNALSGAPSWSNVGPAADYPFNVVAIDPRNPQVIYAGADVGLWRSTDGAATWQRMGPETGLPNASVYDIKINPATGRTVVFTYGRGAYIWGSTFTDEPLDASTIIKAVHLVELRTRIDLLRQRNSLPAYQWNDAPLTPKASIVTVNHVAELRAALNAVYTVMSRQLPAYTDPALVTGQTVVKAAHVNELRAAILAVE